MFGSRVPAQTLRRFWTMLAHNQGALLNASRLAQGLEVKSQTLSRYVDLLVRRLQPYQAKVGKRLVRSPKVYIRDTGLLHALLNIGDPDARSDKTALTLSWALWALSLLVSKHQASRPIFCAASAKCACSASMQG